VNDGRGRLTGCRRWLLLLALAGLLGGCQARPAAGPQPPPAATGRQQPLPIRFAGQKATRMEPFLLAGGLTVFTAEHRGRGTFKIEVLTKDGEPQRILFLATGRYSGSTGIGLRGGIYRLAVAAGMPWKVKITQPRGRAGAALPQRYQGASDALVGPFRIDRNVRVDVEQEGQGDVTVELVSDQGPSLCFPVEESGHFKASRTAMGLEPGNYYLNIEARRTWRLVLHPG
jgi:hypothetical protein